MGKFRRFLWALSRRKPMDTTEEAPTDLDRCLNTLDLTALGVGATLGFGLYVLSGEVAAQKAGPGVVLSFMIAAIASTFSALCYAEFAAKVPKSGSAYAYSYITVGEFVAFVIGWNLTLEHVIGTASLARGYSGYLGSLFNMPQANHTAEWAPEFARSYLTQFDWLAFSLTMLVTGLLLLGVQVSSKFQITFATINLSVALFIFICGLFKADFHNWNLTTSEIPANAGKGGFLPFGFSGVIAGAGTCFFAFVGFDGIAATAEEVKNPRKAIPNSILWTSAIIFVTYCCMSTIQTLIWPYWDQHQAAPLPYIFEQLNMPFAKWTVLIGVLAGLSTSFVGGFLPLPRILYAMARDGVIYRVLSVVSKRFKVPIVATIVGGILIAILASVLEIDQLADMLSIGTLAAYSLVSISVLLLRYEHQKPTNCDAELPMFLKDATSQKMAISTNGGATVTTTSITDNNNEQQQQQQQQPQQVPTTKQVKQQKLSQKMDNVVLAAKELNKEHLKSPTTKNTLDMKGIQLNTEVATSTEDDLKEGAKVSSSSSAATSSSNSSSSSSSSSSDNDDSVSSLGTQSSRSLISLFLDAKKRGLDNKPRLPTEQSTHVSRVIILLLVVVTTLLDFAFVVWGPTLPELQWLPIAVISSLIAITILLTILLDRLPMATPSTNSFEVPLVPTIPLFSVVINTYLMLNLSVMTWIRFAVWMTIGFFIYFTYGIFKSTGYKDSRCD